MEFCEACLNNYMVDNLLTRSGASFYFFASVSHVDFHTFFECPDLEPFSATIKMDVYSIKMPFEFQADSSVVNTA